MSKELNEILTCKWCNGSGINSIYKSFIEWQNNSKEMAPEFCECNPNCLIIINGEAVA